MTRLWQILMVAAMVLFPGFVGAQTATTTEPLEENERAALFPDRNTIEQGRAIAQATCSRCHGMDGVSTDAQRPHLAGQRAVYLYRVVKSYQDGGRIDDSMGHAGSFLNDQGMLSVAAFYSSLPPARLPQGSDDATAPLALNEDPFGDIRPAMRKCIKCHEETGNSTTSGSPNLTAQHPEYFKSSMLAYVDGSRSHKMMRRLVADLDEATIDEMAVFYAVQEPQRSEKQGDGNELAGRRLAKDCASCHGDDGNASAKDTPSLAGQDARYFVKAMQAYLDGERKHEKMYEAVAGLSPQDIVDLATFYAAREPIRRDVRKPLTATEWVARCERCHGLDGNSTDPRFPMLAGQNPGYLSSALQAYAGEQRENSTMHAMADPLRAADIESLAFYFAAKEPKSVVYLELPCPDSPPK